MISLPVRTESFVKLKRSRQHPISDFAPGAMWKFRNPILLCVLTLILLCSCSFLGDASGPGRSVGAIKASGKLIVATRNAPTTYHIDAEGHRAGPEHDLVTAFAKNLGVKVEFLIMDSITEVMRAVQDGEADLGAAGLSQTEQRSETFLFGPTYQQVTQQVVCHREGKRPKKVADLVGLNLLILEGSSYEERLQQLKTRHPDLQWGVTHEWATEQILEKVWIQEIDCTVADSTIVKINRRYFPELVVAFNIQRPESLAWVLPLGATELKDAIEQWLQFFRRSQQLDVVLDRYYQYFPEFDFVNLASFKRHIKNRYPHYKEQFHRIAGEHDLPPHLLAAIAYQESKWDPRAKSPTGVRGIMMLTLITAHSLGIKNRLDPKESIQGGARYLVTLKKLFNENIPEPDRTYMALASYNVGRGHVHDAQTLARRLNKNPNSWDDLQEVLPLLSQRKYYKTLKYGYARGREPVRYVQRIRDYANILEQEKTND